MVKLLVYSLLAVVVAGLLFFYLDLVNDPGYLLVAWGSTTLETSLVAAAVAALILFLLWRLAAWLVTVLNPRRLFSGRNRDSSGRQGHAETRTTEGLQLFVEQQWEKALGILERSFNDDDATLVNFLAAACAAQRLGLEAQWSTVLDKAAKKFPASLSSIRMLRAELLAKNNHFGDSLDILQQLERTTAGSNRQLALSRDIHLQLGDWDRLEALLPSLVKAGVIDEQEDRHLQQQVLLGRLNGLAENTAASEESADALSGKLMALWRQAPQLIREDVELIVRYVDLLVKAGAGEEAARVIEASLERSWDESLVAKYGLEDFGVCSEQLRRGRDWIQEWPNDGQLLLALGRIAMRCRDWELAREYFEASSTIAPGPEVFAELTRLLGSLGEPVAARQCFHRYLQLADTPLPDLPLPAPEGDGLDAVQTTVPDEPEETADNLKE